MRSGLDGTGGQGIGGMDRKDLQRHGLNRCLTPSLQVFRVTYPNEIYSPRGLPSWYISSVVLGRPVALIGPFDMRVEPPSSFSGLPGFPTLPPSEFPLGLLSHGTSTVADTLRTPFVVGSFL